MRYFIQKLQLRAMLFRDYSGAKILESVHHWHPGNDFPLNLDP